MAAISFEGVGKRFGGDVTAVEDVSFTVEDGEFVAFVGPSGCGKSTILRMTAGLERVTSGRILIGGRDVTHLPPGDRDVAMVFQDYALYPQMTVAGNLGYGLRVRRRPRDEVRRRVGEVAAATGLAELLERRPGQLSGGQRQRVAIGRAIVRDPQAFLMDEPLSNLDANLRTHMRAELERLRQRLRVTTLYVTHDQVEAMTLGDRVVVLDRGRVQQIDTPRALFRRPRNAFVASIIGSPAMNLVDVDVAGRAFLLAGAAIDLPGDVDPAGADRLIVGIRPTDLLDGRGGLPAGAARLEVRAEIVEMLGAETRVLFRVPGRAVPTRALGAVAEQPPAAGGEEGTVAMTASLRGAPEIAVGEPLVLGLPLDALHVFDATTQEALARA